MEDIEGKLMNKSALDIFLYFFNDQVMALIVQRLSDMLCNFIQHCVAETLYWHINSIKLQQTFYTLLIEGILVLSIRL